MSRRRLVYSNSVFGAQNAAWPWQRPKGCLAFFCVGSTRITIRHLRNISLFACLSTGENCKVRQRICQDMTPAQGELRANATGQFWGSQDCPGCSQDCRENVQDCAGSFRAALGAPLNVPGSGSLGSSQENHGRSGTVLGILRELSWDNSGHSQEFSRQSKALQTQSGRAPRIALRTRSREVPGPGHLALRLSVLL